jgi:hypothetical protein
MRNLIVAVVLVILSALPACATAELSADQLYGSWRVTQVICSACGGPVLSLKNKVIDIDHDHILNPSGDNCQSAPGLELLKKIHANEALSGPGAGWPGPVHDAVVARTTILYGFVTCEGINYMQVVLVSSDAAFYFLEGNVALELTRVADSRDH